MKRLLIILLIVIVIIILLSKPKMEQKEKNRKAFLKVIQFSEGQPRVQTLTQWFLGLVIR